MNELSYLGNDLVMSELPKAMIKCMLNSPVADSSNASTLFTQSDYNGLSMGKVRKFASEAND